MGTRITRAILPGIISAVMLVSCFGRGIATNDKLFFFPRIMLGSVAEDDGDSDEMTYNFKIIEIIKGLFS